MLPRSHYRFLLIDDEVYHIGVRIKDLGKHINNALREELQDLATVAKFAIVQNVGGRRDSS